MKETDIANDNPSHDPNQNSDMCALQNIDRPLDQVRPCAVASTVECYGRNRRPRRKGTTRTTSNSRTKKEEDSQKKLTRKVEKLLDMAKYELEVDAYRGIFAENDGNEGYGACHGLLNDATREQLDSWEAVGNALYSDCGNTMIDLNLRGICPSIQTWVEEHTEKRIREEAKRTKKKKRRKISASKKLNAIDEDGKRVTDVEDNISVLEKDSPIRGNYCPELKQNNGIIRVRRNPDPSYCCPCDFNPICLATIGGPMDSLVQKILHACVMNGNKHHIGGKVEAMSTCHIIAAEEGRRNVNTDTQQTDFIIKIEDGDDSIPSTLMMSQDVECSQELTIYESCQASKNDNLEIMKKRKADAADLSIKQEDGPILMTNIGEGTQTNQPALLGASLEKNSTTRHEGENNKKLCHLELKNILPHGIYNWKPPLMVNTDNVIDSSSVDILNDFRERILVDSCSVRYHLKKIVLIDEGESSTDRYMEMIKEWHNQMLHEGNETLTQTSAQSFCLPCGMRNLGATCYLNSQFQCLANNPVFLKGVFSWNQINLNNSRMNQVLSDMQHLLARMIYGANSTVCTDAFSTALGLENDEMQDPNEFSRLLFDRMHESFQKLGVSSPEVSNSLQDLLPRLFRGICVYTTKCTNCRRTSERKENFMDLTLPLIDMEDKKGTSKYTTGLLHMTVQLCLDQYLEKENLEGENKYFCDNCGGKCDAERQMGFYQLPPVLNIQLARYVFDLKTFRKQKLMSKVLLPRTLYVPIEKSDREHSKKSAVLNTSKDKKEYVLCAIQNHRGTSAYGGHYVAEAMDWATGMWFEYDDENVVLLPKGPNSSFIPEAHSKTDTKIVKTKGTSDAYNLFYVERSFLARSAKEQINDRDMTNASFLRNDGKHEDITAKVMRERMEAHNHKNAMHLRTKQKQKRMQCRKRGIATDMFQQVPDSSLMASTRLDTSSIKLERNQPHPRKIKSSCKVWVDGKLFRRFMSCSDPMEDILTLKNESILKHSHLLCKHGIGLHPRIARQGKLLATSEYTAYASLLCGERSVILREQEYTQVNSPSLDCQSKLRAVNDCIITTDNNLHCHECVKEYESELRPKVKAMKSLLYLYHYLNPKHDVDFDAINPDKSGNTWCYAVSRSFASYLRKIAMKTMKDAVGKESLQELKSRLHHTMEVNSHAGVDNLNMSSLFKAHVISNSTACADSTVSDSIDPFVNSKITCVHMKCDVANNKRLVIYVVKSTWKEIKKLFPSAIKHKRDYKAVHMCCEACQAERDRKFLLAEKLHSWALDYSKTGTNTDLRDNPVRSNESKMDGDIVRKCLYLVPTRDVESWSRATQLVLAKYRMKKGKEVAMGETITKQLHATLFETTRRKGHVVMSDNVVEPASDIIEWMRPLTCKTHLHTIASLSIVKQVNNINPKINDIRGSDEEIKLMTEASYLNFISSILELNSLLNPSKNSSILCPKEKKEKFRHHHPCMFVKDTVQRSDRVWTNWNNTKHAISETLQNGGTVEFDPPVCKNQCCINMTSEILKYQDSKDGKGVSQTDEIDIVELDVIDADKQRIGTSPTIEFNVHDFDETYDLLTIQTLLEKQCTNKISECLEDAVGPRRSSRTRAGNRGKLVYNVNAHGESNLAKLRLQIFERTSNKTIMNRQLAVFIFQSNECLVQQLQNKYNERSISDILNDLPIPVGVMDYPVINLLFYYENCNSTLNTKRLNGNDHGDEKLMEELIMMAGLSESRLTKPTEPQTRTTGGQGRKEERGFRGTFLQSAVPFTPPVSECDSYSQDVQDVQIIESISDDTMHGMVLPYFNKTSKNQNHEALTMNQNEHTSRLGNIIQNKMLPPHVIDLRDENHTELDDIGTRSTAHNAKDICDPSPCHLVDKNTNLQAVTGALGTKASQHKAKDSNRIPGDHLDLTERLSSWMNSSSISRVGSDSVSNEWDNAQSDRSKPSSMNKSFYLVHKLDLKSWKLCLSWTKTILDVKKEIKRLDMICYLKHVKDCISLAHKDNNKKSENKCAVDKESLLPMRHLICKNHNLTALSISSVVKCINTPCPIFNNDSICNIAEYIPPDEESELLIEADYIKFISSIFELKNILGLSKESNTRSMYDKLEYFKDHHPRLSVAMTSDRPFKDLRNISDSDFETFQSNGQIELKPHICQHCPWASTILEENVESDEGDSHTGIEEEEKEISQRASKIYDDKSMVDSVAIIKFNVYDYDETYELQVIQSLLDKEFSKNTCTLASQSISGTKCGKGRSMYVIHMDRKYSIEKLQHLILNEGPSKSIVNRRLAFISFKPKLSVCHIIPFEHSWNKFLTGDCLEEFSLLTNDPEINILIYSSEGNVSIRNGKIGNEAILNTAEGRLIEGKSMNKSMHLTKTIDSPKNLSPESHTQAIFSRSSPIYYDDGTGVQDENCGVTSLNSSLPNGVMTNGQHNVIHDNKDSIYGINLVQNTSKVDMIEFPSYDADKWGRTSPFFLNEANKSKNGVTYQNDQTTLKTTILERGKALEAIEDSYYTAPNKGGDNLHAMNETSKSINTQMLKSTASSSVLEDDKKLERSKHSEASMNLNNQIPSERIDPKDTTDSRTGDTPGDVSTFDLSPMGLSTMAPLCIVKIPPLPTLKSQLAPLQICEAQNFLSQSKNIFYNKNKGNFFKESCVVGQMENNAKKGCDPCIQELLDLLPDNVQDDKIARNLYRNFIDFRVCIIQDNDTFPISHREMDIIFYFLLEEKGASECHDTLLPYRSLDSIKILFDSVYELHHHVDRNFAIYMDHVKKCVGKILSLEQGRKNNKDIIPWSKYDLSPSALAATKPIVTQSDTVPPLMNVASSLEVLSIEEMKSFIKESKDYINNEQDKKLEKVNDTEESPADPLCAQSLLQFLPYYLQIYSHARNLYRNFADSQDPVEAGWGSLRISRREMDIILYFLSEGIDHIQCQKLLLPYRNEHRLKALFKRVANSKYHTDKRYVIYMEHVKKYVGKIYSLERDEVTYDKRERETLKGTASTALSKYNLSPQALLLTKPSYNEKNGIPPLPSKKGKLTIMNFNEVHTFIKESRIIFYEKCDENFRIDHKSQEMGQGSRQCMQRMLDLIPEFARFDTPVRNLYRNFADSPDPLIGENEALGYSRREMDIILFSLSTKLDYSECQKILLPYRKLSSVKYVFGIVNGLKYHENEKYLSYMEHVKKCVGQILLSEQAGSAYDDTSLKTKKPTETAPRNKKKLTLQIKKTKISTNHINHNRKSKMKRRAKQNL